MLYATIFICGAGFGSIITVVAGVLALRMDSDLWD